MRLWIFSEFCTTQDSWCKIFLARTAGLATRGSHTTPLAPSQRSRRNNECESFATILRDNAAADQRDVVAVVVELGVKPVPHHAPSLFVHENQAAMANPVDGILGQST
jgi:hypothetical protein